MALTLLDFPKDMKVYSLGGDLSENAIVMIIFDREVSRSKIFSFPWLSLLKIRTFQDYGQDINLSVPETFQATNEMKKAFTHSKVIDWEGNHFFTVADRLISRMIFEISAFTYRNSVTFNPNYSYVIDPESAMEYKIA